MSEADSGRTRSVMVDGKGRARAYAIVDASTRTIVAGAQVPGEAVKAAQALKRELTIHKIAHPKCPPWVRSQIMEDADYCAARAAHYQGEAATMRQRAAKLLKAADRAEAAAAKYLKPENPIVEEVGDA